MQKKNGASAHRAKDPKVSGKYLYSLRRFTSDLNDRIVRKAFAAAGAREAGPDAGVVTAEDLVAAARVVLKDAAAEIPERLAPNGTHNGERKSA